MLAFNKRVETPGDTSSVDIGSFSISKLDSNRLSTSLSLEDDYIVLMERTELGMTLCDVRLQVKTNAIRNVKLRRAMGQTS